MTIDTAHPSEEFLRSIDIHTLLPQQEPFVMIDSLIMYDATGTVTETVVADKGFFIKGQKLTSSGLIENIAQTCAARIGYYNKYILKKGIQPGVIAAIRNMKVKGHPKVGQKIRTNITIISQIAELALFKATITAEGKTLTSAEVKMAIKQ